MTVMERVDVARISEQARQVKFGHVLLTLIAAVLFGVGFVGYKVISGVWAVVSKVFGGLWYGAVWTGVAVREGWREARDGTALA